MSKTVLIVDDDNMSSKLAADILMSRDYRTLRIRDGHKVMGIARRHRPCFILMDVKLPGISGMDVAKMLKADDDLKDIPLLAVTASAMRGDKERIFAGGFDGYVFKPISVSNFLETIDLLVFPRYAGTTGDMGAITC